MKPKLTEAALMLALLAAPFLAMPYAAAHDLSVPPLPTFAAPSLPDLGPSYDTDGEDYCNGTLELSTGSNDVACRPWMGKPMIAVPQGGAR